MTAPQINPGEIANWPLLKIVYRTDHDKIADLLPPGIEPGAEPNVHVNIYNVPVKGEPEYGVSTKVPASYRGRARLLRDRSRHRPGVGDLHQPGAERPAQVPLLHRVLPPRRRRRGPLHAPGVHVPRVPRAGHRRRRRSSPPSTRTTSGGSSRRGAVGGVEKSYDFPPHVVDVASVQTTVRKETSTGRLCCATARGIPTRRCSRCASCCPRTWSGPGRSAARSRSPAPLDPLAFWPYADTIGGSRWPGFKGGPRFED